MASYLEEEKEIRQMCCKVPHNTLTAATIRGQIRPIIRLEIQATIESQNML